MNTTLAINNDNKTARVIIIISKAVTCMGVITVVGGTEEVFDN